MKSWIVSMIDSQARDGLDFLMGLFLESLLTQ